MHQHSMDRVSTGSSQSAASAHSSTAHSQSSSTSSSKGSAGSVAAKCFQTRYAELCRRQNSQPLQELREKTAGVLDLVVDRVRLADWLLILKSLPADNVLHSVSIRSRKGYDCIVERADTEKRCLAMRHDPVVCTRFIFPKLIDAVAKMVERSSVLSSFSLSGLPLTGSFVETIAKAIANNTTLKSISFEGSNISDDGCGSLCSVIKCLPNIERINFAGCRLTATGAQHVSNLLRYQKIIRFSEAWHESLRYRDVDPDRIPGLKFIVLSRNPAIGDAGLVSILEVLLEDVWIKSVDVQKCGLTDASAEQILECLQMNKTLITFDIRDNEAVSTRMANMVARQLGVAPEDAAQVTGATVKLEEVKSRERIAFLEKQLEIETLIRKQAEALSEQLNTQLQTHRQVIEEASKPIPEGYMVVPNDELNNLINEVDELRTSSSNTHSSCPTKIMNPNYCDSLPVHKAFSEIATKPTDRHSSSKNSKSECLIRRLNDTIFRSDMSGSASDFIEQNIGDSLMNVGREMMMNQGKPSGGGAAASANPGGDHNYINPSMFFGNNNGSEADESTESNSCSSDEGDGEADSKNDQRAMK